MYGELGKEPHVFSQMIELSRCSLAIAYLFTTVYIHCLSTRSEGISFSINVGEH